jgi:hypothetical protein
MTELLELLTAAPFWVSVLRAALMAAPAGRSAVGFGNINASLRTPALRRGRFALQGLASLIAPTSTSYVDRSLAADPAYSSDGSLLRVDARPDGTGWRTEAVALVGVQFSNFHLFTNHGASLRVAPSFSAAYVGGVVLQATRTRNYGLELLIRKPLTRRLYGWIAYTLMRSQTLLAPLADIPGGKFAADFDQRHNLAVIASVKLPRGWQVGGRFRLVSGMPYTPLLGALQFSGMFTPIFGMYNSARFPAFHQLDLRVDRRWVVRRVSVTAYLDVQNIYNHNNVEAYIYTYDYSSAAGGIGLPIFPSLGVRVDF